MTIIPEVHLGELFQIFAFLVVVLGWLARSKSAQDLIKVNYENVKEQLATMHLELKKLTEIAQSIAVQQNRLDGIDSTIAENKDRIKDLEATILHRRRPRKVVESL